MDKDTKQLLLWLASWALMTWATVKVGGEIGLVLWIAGTVLMLMWAYLDYKIEQLIKERRRKVIDGAERISKAYQAQEAKDV